MKIRVDRSKCISAADCIAVAPGTFELDEEGIAIIKDPHGDPEKIIEEAARSCPTLAIIIEDDNGNQIYPEPTSKPSNPGAASAKGIQTTQSTKPV